MSSPNDLAERLERAAEGSLAFDGDIHRHLFPDDLLMTDGGGVGPNARPAVRQPLRELPQLSGTVIAECINVPAYSTSLDAALALAERVLGGEWTVEIKTGPKRPFHRAIIHPTQAMENKQGRCPMGLSRATAPLALCIAILKAQAALNPGGET